MGKKGVVHRLDGGTERGVAEHIVVQVAPLRVLLVRNTGVSSRGQGSLSLLPVESQLPKRHL